MKIFDDKYEHEIPYALDYLFASEFYSEKDCRYPLTQIYKSNVKDIIGVSPYNCKISIPNMGNGIYNVHLYFHDVREVFISEEYNKFRIDTIIHHKQNYFSVLFIDTIKQYPIKKLNSMRLNSNGIFIEDFRGRSLAYTVNRAENELKKLWTSKYPQIVFTTRWEFTLYLFFNTIDDLNEFIADDSAGFKEDSYNVIKKYDKDGFCSIEAPGYIIDLLENYKSIGGSNYFNSDAMNGLKVI